MTRLPRVSDFINETDYLGRKLCRNCKKPVAKGRRFYCSIKCMNEFNQNHDWHWIRKTILKRDNYTCSICKKRKRKAELDVDHIIPVRCGINPFDNKNLRLLCKECHRAKTKLDREANI